ncbi:MAG: hypothetical protein LBH45_01490 [Campylobacteraceae bacterium]|jgi:hypothetical protein|nr:hypothetical protein [Campylobacteraceae bacterium]
MLRLLTTIAVSSVLAFASEILSENALSAFFKNSFSNEKNYNFESIKLHAIKDIKHPINWRAYFVTLKFRTADRDIEIKEIVFSDGNMISKDFAALKDAKSLKNELFENWNENIKKGDE